MTHKVAQLRVVDVVQQQAGQLLADQHLRLVLLLALPATATACFHREALRRLAADFLESAGRSRRGRQQELQRDEGDVLVGVDTHVQEELEAVGRDEAELLPVEWPATRDVAPLLHGFDKLDEIVIGEVERSDRGVATATAAAGAVVRLPGAQFARFVHVGAKGVHIAEFTVFVLSVNGNMQQRE